LVLFHLLTLPLAQRSRQRQQMDQHQM